MKSFRPLPTDDQLFSTDLANEFSRIETIDVVGPATLSSPLKSDAQAAAAIGAPVFDAKAFHISDAVQTTAVPAWLTGLDLNHFGHGASAPAEPANAAIEADTVPAVDASTAAVIEPAGTAVSTDVAHPSNASAAVEVPVAHAADSTTVAAVATEAHEPSTASAEPTGSAAHAVASTPSTDAVEPAALSSAITEQAVSSDVLPAVGAFVVLDGDHPASHAPTTPHAVLVPWWISAEGATTVSASLDGHDTPPTFPHVISLIPVPADGADRWENHSPFSVNPSGSESTSESFNVSDPVDPASPTASAETVPATDAAPVTETVPHAIIGTVIIHAIDPASVSGTDSSITDLVGVCSPSSPDSWIPKAPVVFNVPVDDHGNATPEATTGVAVTDPTTVAVTLDNVDGLQAETVTLPAVAPLPEVADGADRWENHSMFSVNPPDDAKAAEAVAETVTAVAPESVQAPEAVDDAAILKNFLENWRCNQPVEPDYLRNAPLPEFTLPSLSDGSTETQDVPPFTAEVFHSMSYDAIAAASMPSVSAEQHAVL